MNAVSLFAGVGDICRHCGSANLSDYATPAWYKNRVVLCEDCDRASVIRRIIEKEGK